MPATCFFSCCLCMHAACKCTVKTIMQKCFLDSVCTADAGTLTGVLPFTLNKSVRIRITSRLKSQLHIEFERTTHPGSIQALIAFMHGELGISGIPSDFVRHRGNGSEQRFESSLRVSMNHVKNSLTQSDTRRISRDGCRRRSTGNSRAPSRAAKTDVRSRARRHRPERSRSER